MFYLTRAVHVGGCDSNAPALWRLPRALPRKHCCLLLPQTPKTKAGIQSLFKYCQFCLKTSVVEGSYGILRRLLLHTLKHKANPTFFKYFMFFTPHKQNSSSNLLKFLTITTIKISYFWQQKYYKLFSAYLVLAFWVSLNHSRSVPKKKTTQKFQRHFNKCQQCKQDIFFRLHSLPNIYIEPTLQMCILMYLYELNWNNCTGKSEMMTHLVCDGLHF